MVAILLKVQEEPSINQEIKWFFLVGTILVFILALNLNYVKFLTTFVLVAYSVEITNVIHIKEEFRPVLTSVLCLSFLFLKEISRVEEYSRPLIKPKLATPEKLALFSVSLILSAPFIFRSKFEILSSLFGGYDFAAHSYLMKSMAVCNDLVLNCNLTEDKVVPTSDYGTYPSILHGVFAGFFRTGFADSNYFLPIFGLSVFLTFYISIYSVYFATINFILMPLKTKSNEFLRKFDGVPSKNSFVTYDARLSPKKLKVLVFLIAGFGPINWYLHAGYVNYILSLALFFLSIVLLENRNYQVGILFLIFACEVWTFLYLIGLPIFALVFFKEVLLKKQSGFKFLTEYFLMSFGFGYFAFKVLKYSQASGALIWTNHWIEPWVAILLGLFIFKTSRNVGTNWFIYVIGICTTILFVFQLYLLTQGQVSSYYAWKLSVYILCLEAVWIIKARFSYYKHSKLGTLNSTDYNTIYIFLLTAVVFITLPSQIPFIGPLHTKLGYPSPINLFLHSWNQPSVNSLDAELALEISAQSTRNQPALVLKSGNWIQTTAWVNNLNFSLSKDVDNALIEINAVYSKSNSFVDPLLLKLIPIKSQVFAEDCSKYLSTNIQCSDFDSF